MSKVIKYYYSKPIIKGTIAIKDNIINPWFLKTSNNNIKYGRRYTIATVYDDDSHTIKFGLAICQPVDNFCKAIGRKISEQNAINNPFYIIENFTGRRNDFADEVMEIIKDKETELLKNEYHDLFNPFQFLAVY